MPDWFAGPGDCGPDEIGDVALSAIRWEKDPPRWQHAAVLYRDRGGALRMLELANHCELRNEKPDARWLRKYAIVFEHGMDNEIAMQIAGYCEAVWLANEEEGLPYAFEYEGGGFDPGTAEFVLNSTAPHGLSCSTFILALHKSIGISLLDVGTWPHGRAGDEEEQAAIIEQMKASGQVPLDHIEILRSELGRKVARFRPQEVTSSYSPTRTATSGLAFSEAEPLAWEILCSLMTQELGEFAVAFASWLERLGGVEAQAESPEPSGEDA